MTIDKSLRVKRGATRNRSVLTRVERIARLTEADAWKEGDSPLGLPKVRVRKIRTRPSAAVTTYAGSWVAFGPNLG